MFIKLILVSAILVLIKIGNLQAQTQSDLPRIEVGAHFTSLHLPALQEWPGGVGGRFGYNFLPWAAVEGEFNYYPVTRPKVSGSSSNGFKFQTPGWFGESQALFGIKAGLRGDKFGVFGKIKPGFVHLTDRQNLQLFQDQSKVRFALEIGGVLEVYLARPVALRFDMGETFVNFGRYASIGDYAPQESPKNGFQAGAGIVFRF